MANQYDYIEAGFRVFGLHGMDKKVRCECGDPECEALLKHPRISNWQSTPDWSDDQLETMEAMGHFDTGFGVLCAGFLVVDVDARNGGVASFKKLVEAVPEAGKASFVVNTGSGGGSQHHYFKAPEGVGLLQSLKDYPGVDFKASGFVVGAGSLHASGNTYEVERGHPGDVEEAPAELIDLLRKPSTYRTHTSSGAVDITPSGIAELLNYINNSGSGIDYEDWIRVGMAIHHTTGGSADGYALWDTWSRDSDKYSPAQMEKKWHSFGKAAQPVTIGTLHHMAKEGGYEAPIEFVYQGATINDDTDRIDTSGVDKKRPPGMVGVLTQWINDQCRYPRESMAVASALVAIGNLTGMRIYDAEEDMTANLLAFCVGGSGCHAKGHKILMHDGSEKAVEDIVTGDQLMGWDSSPRTVRALARGREEMAKVTPIKGESFIVNINHILHLRRTGGDETLNITVKDWMARSAKFKSKWKLARFGVSYPERSLPVGAYAVGALLGDGTLQPGKIQITGADKIVHDEVSREIASRFDSIKCVRRNNAQGNKSWHTVFTFGRQGSKYRKSGTPLQSCLADIGLLGTRSHDKRIPSGYMASSRSQRLDLLAGLIDTDGSSNGCGGFDFISKSERLALGVVALCRSLGLAAYAKKCEKTSQTGNKGFYHRVSISGDCSVVPVRVAYKKQKPRKQIKNVLNTGFSVELLPEDDFYGFSISGDHVYLDYSFTAHHNTGKEAVQQAFLQVMKAAGVSGAVHGAFKSEQEVIRNLTRHQAAYYWIDELGMVLRKLSNASKKGGASYLEGVVGIIMSIYSKANGYLPITGDLKESIRQDLIKELGAIRKRMDDESATSEGDDKRERMAKEEARLEQALASIDVGLENPFLSIIGWTTPSTFDELMDVEQATSGFLARALVFRDLETNPRRKTGFKKRPMPDNLRYQLANLYRPGEFDTLEPGGRIEHDGDKSPVRTEPEAMKMLDMVYEEFHALAEEQKDRTGLEALPRRGYEMTSKLSLILAIPDGMRTVEHVRWAYKVAYDDCLEKIRMVYANDRVEDPTDSRSAYAEKVMALLTKDHGETFGVIRNRLRKVPKEALQSLLDEMVEKGKLKREEVEHPVNKRVATKYFAA